MSRGKSGSQAADEFLTAACVPRDGPHVSGTLDEAERIRRDHPEVVSASIFAAAVVGDSEAVSRFLQADPSAATAAGGPCGWDALTYLCFSRYLRLDASRTAGFVASARALLEAGADANSGWFERSHQPQPEWESALYGAAGVAHSAELTRLLLEHGADPNDGEVTYHAPENWDIDCVRALLDTGRLGADSLAAMLLRKCDWHHLEGVRLLLEHGADPNRPTPWHRTAFQQALLRDNSLEIVAAMLGHGADPAAAPPGGLPSAASIAARRGRGDMLRLLQHRGHVVSFQGVERLIACCALGDEEAVRDIGQSDPGLRDQIVRQGGTLLADFAGVGNTDGVRLLLGLGIPVASLYEYGDGYYGIARGSTALHVAAWRARHETVSLLLERGAPVDARDADGRTPLMLAVRACVDSYWTDRRSPESVQALLDAGASPDGALYPSGYPDVDSLLGAAMR